MKIKLPYLEQFKDRHGKLRFYVRVPGRKRIAIKHAIGTPEFMDAYQNALNASPIEAQPTRVKPGTIAELVNRYISESSEFKMSAEATRDWRRRLLLNFANEHGDKRYAQLRPEDIIRLQGKKAGTPHEADKFLKALRRLYDFAKKLKLVSVNPARHEDVTYLRAKIKGWHSWTLAEIEQFKSKHTEGLKARLALALLMLTGQRRSDVVRLGRQHETHDGCLDFAQKKTASASPSQFCRSFAPSSMLAQTSI